MRSCCSESERQAQQKWQRCAPPRERRRRRGCPWSRPLGIQAAGQSLTDSRQPRPFPPSSGSCRQRESLLTSGLKWNFWPRAFSHSPGSGPFRVVLAARLCGGRVEARNSALQRPSATQRSLDTRSPVWDESKSLLNIEAGIFTGPDR